MHSDMVSACMVAEIQMCTEDFCKDVRLITQNYCTDWRWMDKANCLKRLPTCNKENKRIVKDKMQMIEVMRTRMKDIASERFV